MPTKKELEQEIKELNKYPEYFKKKLESSWEYELEEKRLKKEIEELKEENRMFKKANKNCGDIMKKLEQEKSEILTGLNCWKEENEELKDLATRAQITILSIKEANTNLASSVIPMEAEIDELKEENKKLKEEFTFMRCYHEFAAAYHDDPGDINDDRSNISKWLETLPNTSFWKDDLYNDFTDFIEKLVKNTEHKNHH